MESTVFSLMGGRKVSKIHNFNEERREKKQHEVQQDS